MSLSNMIHHLSIGIDDFTSIEYYLTFFTFVWIIIANTSKRCNNSRIVIDKSWSCDGWAQNLFIQIVNECHGSHFVHSFDGDAF